ncbi:Adenosine/AMP deaminase, putative [Angomonas deanei]|uniref:Adenosine/AMP deaminase, putative n=1 Tax=Angomonas deanei TaxID=59799 RepID=A0A7G2CB47_9TRYP|nr:Adenosine/AMP deaminase, putative [Angomonas deanei]
MSDKKDAPVAVDSKAIVSHFLGRRSGVEANTSGDNTSKKERGEAPPRPLFSSPPLDDNNNSSNHNNNKPSYYRITIDGDEGDHNYLKCGEQIYKIIKSRLRFKAIDKGETEGTFSKEELDRFMESHLRQLPFTVMVEEDKALFKDVSQYGLYSSPPTEQEKEQEKTEENTTDNTTNTNCNEKDSGENNTEKDAPTLSYRNGIYHFKGMKTELAPWKEYVSSVQQVYGAIESGPCLSTSRMRVTSLVEKFELYSLLNSNLESIADPYIKGGGVYASCMRVDNSINMKTAVPAPIFMDVITRTAVDAPNTPLFVTDAPTGPVSSSSPQKRNSSEVGSPPRAAANSSPSPVKAESRTGRANTYRGTIVSTVTQAPTEGDLHPSMSESKANRSGSTNGFSLPGMLTSRNSTTTTDNSDGRGGTSLDGEDSTGGRVATIASLLQQGGLSRPHELTMEGLGLHPTLYRNKFIQYDMFNENINPAGKFGSMFLQGVLSTDGPNKGDICGALLRYVLERNEFRKGPAVATEMHLDLYGHHPEELPRLAAWSRRHGFHSLTKMMWSLSINRRLPYEGAPNVLPVTVETIGDQIRSIFYPLFMATLYPKDTYWGTVALLLNKTGSIHIRTQSVTRLETFSTDVPPPDSIKYRKGCSDYYFFYYVWSNLVVLNALRRKLGFHTLNFNPSVQERAPAYDQLVCGFLLGDVVHHVTSLQKSWIMQFLYLYCQVGIVMSPLRDNVLQTPYFEHPVVTYFKMGMRVSISTSDPLHFHHRFDQPLLEEYATLMKVRSSRTGRPLRAGTQQRAKQQLPPCSKGDVVGEGVCADWQRRQ